MGERAKIIINEYTALEILQRSDFDINKFYSSDLRTFISAARKELKRLKEENKKLETTLNAWAETAKDLEKRMYEFMGRNKKAIEYLGIDEEILDSCEIYDVNGIEVYKILQGSDKE